jgi:hypothetical protein
MPPQRSDLSTHPMASDCDAHPCCLNGMPPSTIRIRCTQPPPSNCDTHKPELSKHDARGARRTTHEGTIESWRRGIVPPALQSTHTPNTDALDLQMEGFIFHLFISHLYSCVQGGAKKTFVCSRGCDRSRQVCDHTTVCTDHIVLHKLLVVSSTVVTLVFLTCLPVALHTI